MLSAVALGDFIAMTASILASTTLFAALKWTGVLYLVWLGIKLIKSAKDNDITLMPISGVCAPAHRA